MQEIIGKLINFRNERDWQKYHTPQELARAIGIEAAELNELFLWGREFDDNNVKNELADVMIYCVNMCEVMGFDPIEIMSEKIIKNAKKYPVNGDLKF